MRVVAIISLLLSVMLVTQESAASSVCQISDNSEFANVVKDSCIALQLLCITDPANKFCPEQSSPSTSEHDLEQELSYQGHVSLVVKSLFPFEEKMQQSWASGINYVLSDADLSEYHQKLQLLDELSRSHSQLEQNLVTHITLEATMTWISLYGDPLRNLNLYIDESGRPLPARQNLILSESAQTAAINLSAFTGLVAGVLASKFTSRILKDGRYILAGLRGRLPLSTLTELLIALAPTGAAHMSFKPSMAKSLALTSPAAMVRFELTEEFDLSELDMETTWLKKELDLYNDALSQSSFYGAQMFVGYFGEALAGSSDNKVLQALFKSPGGARLLRWLRITPASLAAGLAVERGITEALFSYRLKKYKNELEAAAHLKNDNLVYQATNKIIKLFTDNLLFTQNQIQLLETLYKYLDLKNTPTAAQSRIRENLSRLIHPINFPDKTGAYLIQGNLCETHEILSQINGANLKDLQVQDRMSRRGAAYRFQSFLKSSLKEKASQIASFKKMAARELDPLLTIDRSGRSAQIFAAKLKKILALEAEVQSYMEMLSRSDAFNNLYQILFNISSSEKATPSVEFKSYYYCESL